MAIASSVAVGDSYSIVTFSTARLTEAAMTPGTFRRSTRSIAAAQLAQVMPVTGRVTRAVTKLLGSGDVRAGRASLRAGS